MVNIEEHNLTRKNGENLNDGSNTSDVSIMCSEEKIQTVVSINWITTSKDFSDSELFDYLKGLAEDDLFSKLKELNVANAALAMENDVYEFTVKDEIFQNDMKMFETAAGTSVDQLTLLSYPLKCYIARKRLEHIQENYEQDNLLCKDQLQEIQFKLESLDWSLNELKESKELFRKSVRTGGRHPVTKQIILQKVAKFFDDSIKHKMAMTNRYKIQIQSNVMEHNKLLSQIKEQERRAASLDQMKYREAMFEHKESCRSLIEHKDQLSKCKLKFSSLNQIVVETKKKIEKEQSRVEQMNVAVSKKEYMKNVMFSEKARNDQKVKELDAAMHKMQLNPRRHNLPEVLDYAIVKRENETLKQSIAKWKKKVELVEQAKRLYLSAQKKTAKLG